MLMTEVKHMVDIHTGRELAGRHHHTLDFLALLAVLVALTFIITCIDDDPTSTGLATASTIALYRVWRSGGCRTPAPGCMGRNVSVVRRRSHRRANVRRPRPRAD
jgi:hypothetical protein